MKGFISRLLRNESGATAIEYGLICSLIFLAICGAVGATNGSVSSMLIQAFQKLTAGI